MNNNFSKLVMVKVVDLQTKYRLMVYYKIICNNSWHDLASVSRYFCFQKSKVIKMYFSLINTLRKPFDLGCSVKLSIVGQVLSV